MDGSLQLPPLARLLVLNTEIHELRSALLRQPLASGLIAELQEGIDQRHRASLTTCWLSGGYELEPDDDAEEDWEAGSTGDA
jgi:hypothetical protein